MDGVVLACATWDPDGPGPAGELVVVGGGFQLAGGVPASCIATYDRTSRTWSALGAGCNGTVLATCVMPNGHLLVAGGFTVAGAVPANRIAVWDGVAWSALGAGFDGAVQAVCVLPNGDIVAGGSFTLAGGAPASRIARWNGSSWSALGAGVNNVVRALTAMSNGDVVAGGQFTSAGGQSANFIARWDGSNWQALGGGAGGVVLSLCALPNGECVAGGGFTTAGGVAVNGIAKWDGVAWSDLGAGQPLSVAFALAAQSGGGLVAAGGCGPAPVEQGCVARWDGTAWQALGNVMSGTPFSAATFVRAVAVSANGELVAGGGFTSAGGNLANGIAAWDGREWSPLGRGSGGYSYRSHRRVFGISANGDLLVGGYNPTSYTPNYVGLWDGAVWKALGSFERYGDLYPNSVQAMATMPNGELVVGGDFAAVDGVSVSNVARYDGTAWHSMGFMGPVYAVAAGPHGDVYAADAQLFRWDGSAWQLFGGGLGGSATHLEFLANGDLLVGGSFQTAGNIAAQNIVRWDGSAWHALGAGVGGSVYCSTTLPNGDLVVGGSFLTAGGVPANHVARWDGSAWHAMGSGMSGGTASGTSVSGLVTLPNGDVLAKGNFTAAGGLQANQLARWDGSSWQPVPATIAYNQAISAMIAMPNGDVVLGGALAGLNATYPNRLARLTTTCPATAAAVSTACVGPAGPVTLTAATLPWTGSTFRATATGFAANSLAVGMIGIGSPGSPLSQLHPTGIPGCSLLTNPMDWTLLVPTAGAASWLFSIPNDPIYAGVLLHHQMLQLEMDTAPSLLSLSSSSALALTIGSF